MFKELDKNARPLTKQEFAQFSEGVQHAHEGPPVNKEKQAVAAKPNNNKDIRSKHGVQQPRGTNH